MKNKTIVLIPVILLGLLIITGCPPHKIGPDPIPELTPFTLVDDFSDGDNKSSFGGYWYTYDDLAASMTCQTPGGCANCGKSTICPMSENASKKYYGAVATPVFELSSYSVTSQTPPGGVTSGFYARISGTVDTSATNAFQYGFAGFGVNLLEVAGDGFKNTVNATALGYKKLRFWYKNGPSLGALATCPWKVKLSSNAVVGGSAGCTMGDGDNAPVKAFTSNNTWQKFEADLTAFAPETGWGSDNYSGSCDRSSFATTCVAGVVSNIDSAPKFKCNAAAALMALNAIQFQTGFSTQNSAFPYDLMIAQVELVK